MKDALYAIFREIAEAWLGQWFVPREDYEFVRRSSDRTREEACAWKQIGARHAHDRELLREVLGRVANEEDGLTGEMEATIKTALRRTEHDDV